MITTPKLLTRVECNNLLGEGVIWDHRTQRVLWTDIQGRAIYVSAPPFERFEVIKVPERVGSFGLLGDDEGAVVAAFESGFARLDLTTGRHDWLVKPKLETGIRFNDGRVSRSGEFWAGTMVEDESASNGARGELFRLARDGTCNAIIKDIGISNSLCWNLDGSKMYFADTPRQLIVQYDVVDGLPVNKREFARTSGSAFPDGATVDADGFLWNAQWGSGNLVRYAPNGVVDLVVPVPAPNVTCVAFGGENLDLLFVTSARIEMTKEELEKFPHAGSLFIFESPVKGLPESVCTLDHHGFE